MAARGVDVTLLSVGADLPWLTGYRAMPLERLTMLVVPVDAPATMFVPRLEVPRVVERPDVFSVVGWAETTDPVALVAAAVGSARTVSIGDQTWARFLVELLGELPSVRWERASGVVGPLRAVKDASEIEGLRRAAEAVDRIAAELQSGAIALV